jgi:hypothetical protein
MLVLTAAIQAAPPTVNFLYPAGGQRGTSVGVEASGATTSWPVQTWSDKPGLTITPGKQPGKLDVAIAADALPGTYWIRLYNEEGSSLARPFLVGTLPEVVEKEPNDMARAPQTLNEARIVVNGKLDKAGDVDVFSVPLKKGETLVASVEAYRTLRSPMDGILQILSAEGFVLEQNHDYYDLDPLLAFIAPKDGTYLIRIMAFPSVPDSAVRFSGGEKYVYRLTLTTGPFVDSVYPPVLTRSQPQAVELRGWNLPAPFKKFPVTASPSATTALVHAADLGNTATLAVDTLPVIKRQTGSGTQKVALPANLVGRLEKPGDVAVYEFAAKKGQRIAWKLEAKSLYSALDGVLRFPDFSAKLTSARGAKPGDDPAIVTPITADGTYRVEVHDLHDGGGPRHFYRLRAALEPEFDLKLAADRYALLPGTPLDLTVTIDRQPGFTKELEFAVEGLPKEIAMKTEYKEPPASAKSAVIQLSTSLEKWSGPIRIVGKVKGEEASAKPALATYPEYAAVTDRAWLTASASGKVAAPPVKKKKGTMQ